MKKIKQAFYKMMSNRYADLAAMCVDQIELAACEGDKEGLDYWCALSNKYHAKQRKYESKLQ